MSTLKLFLSAWSPGYTPTSAKGTWTDGTPLVNMKCSTSKDGTGAPESGGASARDGTSGHIYTVMRRISVALAPGSTFQAA